MYLAYASVNQVEDQRLLEEAMREMQLDEAINQAPVTTQVQVGPLDLQQSGVRYQQCGGGRRILRKSLGGS